MKDESFLKSIYHLVLRMRTMTLVNILTGIGLSFFVFCLLFQKYERDIVKGTLLLLFSFFIGLSGLIIIIRKEVNYTIINFDGLPALLIGIIISLASLIFSILLFTGILRFLAK